MYVCQSASDSVVVIVQTLMIYPEQMQYRGVEIVPVDDFVLGLPADFVGGAVGYAVLEPGSRQPKAEAVLVVIAAQPDRIGSRLRKWRSAKLGSEQNQSIIEHAAAAQVSQQTGDG